MNSMQEKSHPSGDQIGLQFWPAESSETFSQTPVQIIAAEKSNLETVKPFQLVKYLSSVQSDGDPGRYSFPLQLYFTVGKGHFGEKKREVCLSGG